MSTDKVFIRDLVKTINFYKFRILLICAVCIGFSWQLTEWMEKQFVSTFEINVYSKYFQNPLISGVIPDVYNIPEMRFAIDSMIKEAISDDFIDEIGTSYKIYKVTEDDREKARERQLLRDKFTYFSTGGQSYQISFTHSDPYIAKEITTKTMEVVKDHIINKRIKTIELVKEVMIRKLNSFNASQKFTLSGAEKALASKSPEVLREELIKLKTSLEAMTKQYKDSHPIIQNLKQRQRDITAWLTEYDMSKYDGAVDLPVAMTHDKLISEQLSSKFYAKYHDFNIALEIEKKSIETYIGIIKRPQLPSSPVWPKKKLFASLGFIIGLIFAFIYVFVSEIILPSTDEKLAMEAEAFDTVVLGTMSKYKKASKKRIVVAHTPELEKMILETST